MRYLPWQENYIPEPNSGCWLWLGACNAGGYGMVYPAGKEGGQHRIHRLMYEMHYGPIPDGLGALHRCDNPVCCNPEHIFLGTNLDNGRDRSSKGRNHDQGGEKGPNSKLTAREVEYIRASDEKQRVLAEMFGVTQPQISKIKNLKRW